MKKEGTVLQEQQFPKIVKACEAMVGDGGRCRNPVMSNVKLCAIHLKEASPTPAPQPDVVEISINVGKDGNKLNWLLANVPLRERNVRRSQELAEERAGIAESMGRAAEVYRQDNKEHINVVPTSLVDDGTKVFNPSDRQRSYLPNASIKNLARELKNNGYNLTDAYRLAQSGQKVPVIKLKLVFSREGEQTESARNFSWKTYYEFLVNDSVFGEIHVFVNPRRPEDHPSSYAGKIVHTVNCRMRKEGIPLYYVSFNDGKWGYGQTS